MKISELIHRKGPYPMVFVEPHDTVFDALKLLSKIDVGAVPVMKNGSVIGIFSERDYARKVFLQGRSSLNTIVEQAMSHSVIYVDPDFELEECLAVMTSQRILHLPVFDGDDLVAFLSMEEIVEALIEDKDFIIGELTKYITGSVKQKPHQPTGPDLKIKKIDKSTTL